MKTPISLQYRKALTIAGSDSSGGAGIQADLKTFAALGCYGASVVTAVTAQNTLGVSAVHPIPSEIIRQQLDAVLCDMGADAVKIGMLFSRQAIVNVATCLQRSGIKNIVLDPVMAAQSGRCLLEQDAMEPLQSCLIPLCLLITPNLPEAEAILNRPISSLSQMRSAAIALSALGPTNVLLKGGHSKTHPATDVLYLFKEKKTFVLENDKISSRNNHGTGCTLSSAIVARLARGSDIKEAVRRAKDYVTRALEAGASYQIGHGHGPVHHFYEYWK